MQESATNIAVGTLKQRERNQNVATIAWDIDGVDNLWLNRAFAVIARPQMKLC